MNRFEPFLAEKKFSKAMQAMTTERHFFFHRRFINEEN